MLRLIKHLCFLPALVLLYSFSVSAQYQLNSSQTLLENEVMEACKLPIKFDLHNYFYSMDEYSYFSSVDELDCGRLAHAMAKACKGHPKNVTALNTIRVVECKRASMGERKLLLRKNGTLVYLIGTNPAENAFDRSDLIEKDLGRVLKLDFKADYKAEMAKATEEKEKLEEAKQEAERLKDIDEQQSRNVARQAKIQAIMKKFQEDMQKLSKNPSPDMTKKMEQLTKKMQEDLNAAQTQP